MKPNGVVLGILLFIVPAVTSFVITYYVKPNKMSASGLNEEDFMVIQTRLSELESKVDSLGSQKPRIESLGRQENSQPSDRHQTSISENTNKSIDGRNLGSIIASLEGRVDALTLNKNYTQVFYPVGQEHLFFKHFPQHRYHVVSRRETTDGSIYGTQFTVRRKILVENYKDPYNKTFRAIAH